MKYKTKIEPEGAGFIGYVILNGQTIYTSNILRDPVAVSREISSFINKQPAPLIQQRPIPQKNESSVVVPRTDNNLVPSKVLRKSAEAEETTTNNFQPMPPPPRRCCGRG